MNFKLLWNQVLPASTCLIFGLSSLLAAEQLSAKKDSIKPVSASSQPVSQQRTQAED